MVSLSCKIRALCGSLDSGVRYWILVLVVWIVEVFAVPVGGEADADHDADFVGVGWETGCSTVAGGAGLETGVD